MGSRKEINEEYKKDIQRIKGRYEKKKGRYVPSIISINKPKEMPVLVWEAEP